VGGGLPTATSGTTEPPTYLQKTYPKCNGKKVPADLNVQFLGEVACDSGVAFENLHCRPTDKYPRRTGIVMHPLPKHLKTMPDPCAGVPKNPWCKSP
jgi:hypothetical protein